MTTSVFFNNFQNSQEQFLIEDLVIESIRIYGHEVFYLPRTRIAYDSVYGEDVLSEFRSSYIIEMFIKNIDGFDGDGDFISKFGLEIRDRVTFSIARRTFNNEIGSNTNAVRPNEGDLIFLPLNKKIFEIKFVEQEAIFYQMGALQTFDLVCELYEYSSEKFSTGIDFIDTLFTNNYLTGKNYSEIISDFGFITEDSNPYDIITEDLFRIIQEDSNINLGDGYVLQNEASTFVDFSEVDPFAEGSY
jgi:hypothetical protein